MDLKQNPCPQVINNRSDRCELYSFCAQHDVGCNVVGGSLQGEIKEESSCTEEITMELYPEGYVIFFSRRINEREGCCANWKQPKQTLQVWAKMVLVPADELPGWEQQQATLEGP